MADPKSSPLERYKDFKATFEGARGKRIMADLSRFCCYNHSTVAAVDFKVDAERMLIHEGRRQVYLYIIACLVEPKEPPVQEEKGEFD